MAARKHVACVKRAGGAKAEAHCTPVISMS
jgi:hypothetical protein